jgi:hypothetical protein
MHFRNLKVPRILISQPPFIYSVVHMGYAGRLREVALGMDVAAVCREAN